MQITETLAQMGGLRSIAQQLGVTEAQVASGADALIPAILGGFKKQTQTQSSGAEGLAGLLGQLGGAGLLDNALAAKPGQLDSGNQVLGQIFGSKDVSRTVAQSASAQSGLDPELLKKMLPMLAMLVTGFMAKRGVGSDATAQDDTAQGGLGGLLGNLLGGAQSSGSQAGGLTSLLDMNGDGNALDDIMRMAGKFMR
ncbi:MAG: DUF937 domain-containing protein [Burkholderiaceae bacterium]|nr:DUF937 domain-containing protein [Burkholderiaceae bacterium]